MSKLALTFAFALALTALANTAAAQDVAPKPQKPLIDRFDGPALALGARVGPMTAEGTITLPISPTMKSTEAYTGTGRTFGGEVGVHFAPSWTFFGSYDYGSLERTSMLAMIDDFQTHTVAAGFRGTTNRRSHIGFVTELGAGYRWLSLSKTGATYIGHGVEPLRGGIGVTILATSGIRVNVMASIAAGLVTHLDFAGDGCVGDKASACDVVPERDRKWQIYRSLTIGGTFDL